MWKILLPFFKSIDPGWNDFRLIEKHSLGNPLPSLQKPEKLLQRCGGFLPGQHVTIEKALLI